MVRAGIGSDSRIGNKFLYPGCGYGGSCFPKDVKAIINTGLQHGYRMKVMEAVDEMNERQKEVLFHKLSSFFEGQLEGKTIGIWGLSYKPQTDDMREAPSLVLIDKLLKAGCKVQAYDPVAMDECRRRLGDRITYAKDLYQAAANAHALILVTEWKEFRMPGWEILKKVMKQPVVLDGRNIYLAEDMAANGFHYLCIGR
jgi:UDPglucose 6-dehydrogenase